MAVTIADVARYSGVAKSTVSRVLSGRGQTSEQTRQRVLQAIEALDYRPNALAQALATHSTDRIGVILPSDSNMSKCLASMVNELHTMAALKEKSILMKQVRDESGAALASISELIDQRCEAVLYYNPSSFANYNETIDVLNRTLSDFPVPVILLNSYLDEYPNHSVWYDQIRFGAKPVEYLLQCGHRDIAYLSGSLTQRTAQLRLQGYQSALKQAGIPFNPMLFVEGKVAEFEEGSQDAGWIGYHACIQLIERDVEFSAICCFSDGVAIGAHKALQERGYVIPDDVSLFGFDNDPLLNYFSPSISSVILPSEAFITHGIELAMAHLTGAPLPDYPTKKLSAQLVIRDSVCAR